MRLRPESDYEVEMDAKHKSKKKATTAAAKKKREAKEGGKKKAKHVVEAVDDDVDDEDPKTTTTTTTMSTTAAPTTIPPNTAQPDVLELLRRVQQLNDDGYLTSSEVLSAKGNVIDAMSNQQELHRAEKVLSDWHESYYKMFKSDANKGGIMGLRDANDLKDLLNRW